jgi:lysophospholipase L1-like esterase
VKSFAGHLLLAVASLVFWLALIEAGLRLAGYRPEPPANTLFSWSRKGQLWLLPPNSRSKTIVGDYPVHTNSLGLRDREIGAKAPGSHRILFLGDSVTFGHGQPADAIFVRQLEEIFRRRGQDVQVINAGIFGWSTRQERLFYQEYAAPFGADLVLLGFVLNDIPELKTGIDSPASAGSMAALNVVTTLAQWTATVGLLKHLYVETFAPQLRAVAAVEQVVRDPDAPEVRRAMDLTMDELLQLATLARERGERFGIVLFPFRFQLEAPDLDAPQRQLVAFAAQHRIPILDMMPLLRPLPPDRVFMDVDHFTPEGHAVVAREVAAWIDREGLLDSPR